MSPLLGCMGCYNVREFTFISDLDSTSEEKEILRKKTPTILKGFVTAEVTPYFAQNSKDTEA